MSSTHVSAKTYLVIWGWLTGLMLLGVVLSELPISKTMIVLIVLALSSIKAVLVALYYMHLQSDRRLLAVILIAPFLLIALALGVVCSGYWIRL